jgi:hypothetical protein
MSLLSSHAPGKVCNVHEATSRRGLRKPFEFSLNFSLNFTVEPLLGKVTCLMVTIHRSV